MEVYGAPATVATSYCGAGAPARELPSARKAPFRAPRPRNLACSARQA